MKRYQKTSLLKIFIIILLFLIIPSPIILQQDTSHDNTVSTETGVSFLTALGFLLLATTLLSMIAGDGFLIMELSSKSFILTFFCFIYLLIVPWLIINFVHLLIGKIKHKHNT